MKIRGQLILDPKDRVESLSKINIITGCWEWQSAFKGKSKLKRYGHLTVGSRTNGTRRTMSAHRYSWEAFIGKIPKGMWVLHRCDNPSCVNPDHLFLGLRQDNVNDREQKQRNKMPKLVGEQHPRAKLTWMQVEVMRRLLKDGAPRKLVAKWYKISERTISDIATYKTWKLYY
jgi:hypothetical protein